MYISSYMLSLLVHVAILVAVWLWPTSTMVQLDKPMIQISLTMGAPGGDRLPSAVLGPQGQPAPREAPAKPAPAAAAQQQIAGEALPEATRPERLETLPEAPKPAEARPEPKPEPKPAPKPDPKPAPPDVALTNPQRKPEEKPKPDPKPDPKPEPKPDPKPEKKPETKPETKAEAKPEKKAPSADDILRSALSEARTKAGPETPARGNARSSVAGALAQAERKVRSDGAGGGGGGEGSGPGGGGIYDVYAGMVILAIRPNWSMPTYSRDMLIAQVRVRMDASGNVLNAAIERSSGRADFDASAVNAVLRTKTLPPPPTPEQLEIVIGFNSLEMAGR